MNSWCRFLTGFFVAVFLSLFLWCFLWLNAIGVPTSSSKWMYDAYAIKANRASILNNRPAIVIVGGSNTLFGINSELLESLTGYPVINTGVNAGLLLSYTLYSADRFIKPNDIVVMMLEYPMYNYQGEVGESLIDYTLARAPDYFYHANLADKIRLVFMAPLKRLLVGTRFNPDSNQSSGIYNAVNINAYGDQINTGNAYFTEAILSELNSNSSARSYGRLRNPDGQGWKKIEAFVSDRQATNPCIFLMPPAFLENAYYRQNSVERYFYDNLSNDARRHNLTFLGQPFDFMYERRHFFNTDYHLRDEGRDLHTRSVAALLVPAIKTCN